MTMCDMSVGLPAPAPAPTAGSPPGPRCRTWPRPHRSRWAGWWVILGDESSTQW